MTVLRLFGRLCDHASAALGRKGFRPDKTRRMETARTASTRVLLVGATGGTGRQLVIQALERDYAVTALVRNPLKVGIDLDYAEVNALRAQIQALASLFYADASNDVAPEVTTSGSHGSGFPEAR